MANFGEDISGDVLGAFAIREFHSAVGNVFVTVDGSLSVASIRVRKFDQRCAVQAKTGINAALTRARADLSERLAVALHLDLPPKSIRSVDNAPQYRAECGGVTAVVDGDTWLLTELVVPEESCVAHIPEAVNTALAEAEASRGIPKSIEARWETIVKDLHDVEALLAAVLAEPKRYEE